MSSHFDYLCDIIFFEVKMSYEKFGKFGSKSFFRCWLGVRSLWKAFDATSGRAQYDAKGNGGKIAGQ